MEFRPAPGNAGTGKCQRGTYEHGCEFVPVAGPYKICLEILSAPCSYYVASVLRRTVPASCQTLERLLSITKRKICSLELRYFMSKPPVLRIQPFEIIISFRNHIFVSLYPLDWIFFKKNIILFLYIKMQHIVEL